MIPTMNGESVEIGRNVYTITVNGVVINADTMSAVETFNGNIIYAINKVLLLPSIMANLSDILAPCDETTATRYCKGQRKKFDFVGSQNCASCGGYFQEGQNCDYSYLEPDRQYCIEECQWFNKYCTEECCWDTQAEQPDLSPSFKEECFPEQCWRSELKSWTVAPCDPSLTVHAGWHVAKKSNQFNRQRNKQCKVEEFAKQNSLTSVWDVDCTAMWNRNNLKFFSSCDDRNLTVAVWMEDEDGNFAGYYLDPHQQQIGPTSDNCIIEEKFRMVLWLLPTLILVLILCCCCFCHWRRNSKNSAAALDDAIGPIDNNTVANVRVSVDSEKNEEKKMVKEEEEKEEDGSLRNKL